MCVRYYVTRDRKSDENQQQGERKLHNRQMNVSEVQKFDLMQNLPRTYSSDKSIGKPTNRKMFLWVGGSTATGFSYDDGIWCRVYVYGGRGGCGGELSIWHRLLWYDSHGGESNISKCNYIARWRWSYRHASWISISIRRRGVRRFAERGAISTYISRSLSKRKDVHHQDNSLPEPRSSKRILFPFLL